VLVDTQDVLGEGPIWWKAQDALAWVDILDGEIHVASWEGEHLETYRFSEPVGCVFEDADGQLIAGCQSGLRSVETRELLVRLPDSINGVRINDGKVDPFGRFVFGTMGYPDVIPGAGSLWRYDGERLEELLSGLTIPNGLDWLGDASQMYFVDTPTKQVKLFSYGSEGNDFSELGVWASLEHQPGVPDGLSRMGDDVFVAMWDGGSVLKIRASGTIVALQTEVQRTTSVMVHPHKSALIVTTASLDTASHQHRHATSAAGAVLQIIL
jgi:sugar lactone lactonase YvrE